MEQEFFPTLPTLSASALRRSRMDSRATNPLQKRVRVWLIKTLLLPTLV